MKMKKNSILFWVAISIMLLNSSCKNNVDADYNPDPATVTSCTSTGLDQVVCLSNALLSKLDASQTSMVQLSYSATTAKKWSNFPEAIYGQRPGISFSELSSEQISYAKAIIKAAANTSGDEGWTEIQQIINADEYLQANGGGDDYGAENYFIAFLGTPSTSERWELMFGGHHLAFANTYNNGVLIGATPSFRSSEPYTAFTLNGVSNQPMVQEGNELTAMLQSLSTSAQNEAKLTQTFNDIVVGPQKDGTFPTTPVGKKVGELTQAQKDLVLAAIATYVNDLPSTDAATILAQYQSELDDTYIAYAGGVDMSTQGNYCRIDGPSVWIEWSMNAGIVLSGPHPHSVWRDKVQDYGGN